MIEWKDPPRRTGSSIALFEIAEELRRHPGVWAKIRTTDTLTAASSWTSTSRHGARTAFRPVGAFEFTAHGCDIYARYVGDGDA